jgi:ribonuclease HII
MTAQVSFDLAAPGLRAGVDEAGRGPLAGPVVAAAVILDPRRRIRGIKDSKVLEPEEREELAIKIRAGALAWSVAWADVEEIDTLNILQATYLAMRRALLGLRVRPAHVQIDGDRCPSFMGLSLDCSFEAIVDGDARRICIGAASILAKVRRDAMMVGLDRLYPQYGFRQHKGYATPEHCAALEKYGPSPIHRRSFEPVRLAAAGIHI